MTGGGCVDEKRGRHFSQGSSGKLVGRCGLGDKGVEEEEEE